MRIASLRGFARFSIRGFDGHTISVSVPSLFYRNWLSANFRDKIVSAIGKVTHADVDLTFTVAPSGVDASGRAAYEELRASDSVQELGRPGQPIGQTIEFPRPSCLNPKYTFDNFVVGESNRFAHAASRQVSDPNSKSYNPLFIYGGVGLGKTHLMHAVGHQLMAMNRSLRVLYVTSEQFMNSFIEAISQGKQADFRDFYRTIDLLMIDDVQFFSGKERTQTEFFHTFNALYDAGKKIVVSSDRSPRELTTLEDRLRNRFSWGLVVDIQPPDLETRIAILKRKATVENVDLPHEVTLYIAERVPSNIRELEGVLTRLRAYSALHAQPITLQLAQSVLGHLLENEAPKAVDVDTVITSVCDYFELKRADLLGSSRLKRYSNPRHVAQYLTRKLTTLSYPEIAVRFGGRDHTSVLHACRKIEQEMERDENLKNLVAYLTKRIPRQSRRRGRAVNPRSCSRRRARVPRVPRGPTMGNSASWSSSLTHHAHADALSLQGSVNMCNLARVLL